MKLPTIDRASSLGCLMSAAGAVVLALIGLRLGRAYFIGALVLLVVGLIIDRFAQSYRIRVHERALREVFSGFDGAFPHLTIKSRYSYPAFELVFRSEAEMNQAYSSGRVARFKAALQQLNRHYGSKTQPFDVDKAFTMKWDATKTQRL